MSDWLSHEQGNLKEHVKHEIFPGERAIFDSTNNPGS